MRQRCCLSVLRQTVLLLPLRILPKKDFVPAGMKIDRALAGQIAGLQVTRGSGMPGEGSYLNFRGVRSFVGNNAPLVVINGIPHIPDVNDSPLINGLSRNIFQAYNLQDIQNITIFERCRGCFIWFYGC